VKKSTKKVAPKKPSRAERITARIGRLDAAIAKRQARIERTNLAIKKRQDRIVTLKKLLATLK